jgi:dienelactone hydrolase
MLLALPLLGALLAAAPAAAAPAAPAAAAASSPGDTAALKALVQYDARAPLRLETVGERVQGEARVADIRFDASGRVGAPNVVKGFLVRPVKGEGPHAALLYVHWLGEPPNDRHQFLDEAVRMARHGVVSLLVDAMWAEPEWYGKRKHEEDHARSVRQVIALRRALDVLHAQPGVDPARVGYVGHDFGAMYGTLLGAVEQGRLSTLVLLAGTGQFRDWYLYGKKKPADLPAYLAQMAPLDPVRHVGQVGVPVFFQFATEDRYVPKEKAEEFLGAAREPKSAGFYKAEHSLSTKDGVAERFLWLKRQLKLGR